MLVMVSQMFVMASQITDIFFLMCIQQFVHTNNKEKKEKFRITGSLGLGVGVVVVV